MWSITWQMMRRNLRMLIPAGIAVLVGTAFIAATFLFSNAMDVAMREQVTAQYGDANYALSVDAQSPSADDAYATTYGELHADRIGQITGVEGVRPDASTLASLGSDGRNVSDVVVATSKDASLLPVTIAKGVAPLPDGTREVAIPAKLAADWGVRVGDTVRLDAASGTGTTADAVEAHVTGLTDDPTGAYNYYGGATVVSDDVLTRLAGAASMDELNVSRLYLRLAPAQADAAGDAILKLVPAGFTVASREELADKALKAMGGGIDVTQNFLLAFGILALVVAALVIANTFQVLVAQRRRTLALLRTIGATKRQLYVSVLQEALLLGLVASLLGVAVGTGLMALVVATGVANGTIAGTMHFVFSWQVVVVPVLFGTIMTVLASLGAARMATGVTPLEAMRPVELDDRKRARVGRAIIGLLCLVAGCGLVALGLANKGSEGGTEAEMALLAAVAGCALAFIGAAVTAVYWMPWLMRGAGDLVSLCGSSARLAAANIRKNPRRVAATGTALLIGVTLISTLATGAYGAKATMSRELDTRYSVDLVVTGQDVPRAAADEAAKVAGVAHSVYAPVARGTFTDANGREVDAAIIGMPDEAALQSVLNVDLDGAKLGDRDVILQRYEAYSGKELAFKDRVTLSEVKVDADGVPSGTADGTHRAELTVTQRDLRRVSDDQAVAFVNDKLFEDGTFDAQSHIQLIKVDRSAGTLSSTVDGVTKAYEATPGVSVGGPVMERQTWENMVNVMLALLVALLAVAVVIAVIGVANTLSLSVIERTKESATLRAIGMTRGQLRASLCVEAVLIAVVASVVGMVLGTLFGWIGLEMVMSQFARVAFVVDWGTYGIILLLAIVCALLASVFPARRATRTPPVEALSEA